MAYRWLGLNPASRLGGAVHFFIYDSLKIAVMLAAMIYAVSVVRSFFPPERTRAILARRHAWVGHLAAAMLGVLTPFCSCSAVPVFIGWAPPPPAG